MPPVPPRAPSSPFVSANPSRSPGAEPDRSKNGPAESRDLGFPRVRIPMDVIPNRAKGPVRNLLFRRAQADSRFLTDSPTRFGMTSQTVGATPSTIAASSTPSSRPASASPIVSRLSAATPLSPPVILRRRLWRRRTHAFCRHTSHAADESIGPSARKERGPQDDNPKIPLCPSVVKDVEAPSSTLASASGYRSNCEGTAQPGNLRVFHRSM